MIYAIILLIVTWIATIGWGLWNHPWITSGLLLATIAVLLLFVHYGMGRVGNDRL